VTDEQVDGRHREETLMTGLPGERDREDFPPRAKKMPRWESSFSHLVLKLGHRALIAPAVCLLIVFFGYPVLWLLVRSVSQPVWGVQNYARLIHESVFGRLIWNTFSISAMTTFWSALIGYPIAYTMTNSNEVGRRILMFFVMVPFWTSILARTFGWIVILQKHGLVNDFLLSFGLIAEPIALLYNRVGLLVGMVQISLPFMIFPLYSVMAKIDKNYAYAASTLGAGPVRNFWRVYLPLSLPGLVAGATLVFISALGFYVTPALLGGPSDLMLAQMIAQQIGDFGNWGVASALAVVLLAVTALCLGLVDRLLGARTAWSRS
jgi:putative spermidine/putrescine transport system permease protein